MQTISITNKDFEEIKTMPVNQFVTFYSKLTEKEIFIKSFNIKQFPITHIRIILSNSNYKQKLEILNDKEIYDLIVNQNKSFTMFIKNLINNDKEMLKALLESENAKEYKEQFHQFLNTATDEKYIDLIKQFDFSKILTQTNDNEDLIISKFKNIIDKELYQDYNLICFTSLEEDKIKFSNNFILDINIYSKLKKSHIKKIIQLLKNKDNTDKDNNYYEIAVKLYIIFGFDNAKKILDDKFTYLTEDSIKRISKFNFKYNRDEFRLSNQKCFYHYSLEEEVIKTLTNNFNNQVIYDLLGTKNETKVQNFKKDLLKYLNKFPSQEEYDANLKQYLQDTIFKREEQIKKLFYKEIHDILKRELETKQSKNKTTAQKLKKHLNEVNVNKVFTMYENNPKIQDALIKTLLGNLKVNNDCIFRLIYNEQALGLNNNLSHLINNFQRFNNISSKSNLSLNSVIDIMDLFKIELLELKANEKDIKLSTLTKIVNNNNFIIDKEIDKLKETLKLHKKRKFKVYSTIPSVSGSIHNNKYYTAKFDAEYLLAAGIDAENCLRIGGLGQKFFEYCLTSKNAVLIYFEVNSKKFIIPTIRSGNGIHLNGIDPKPTQEELDILLPLINKCTTEIINNSYSETEKKNTIEIVTLSNLNIGDKLNDLEKYSDSQDILCIKGGMHTDFTSSKTNNYIINKSKEYQRNSFFQSEEEYYQERDENYEYDTTIDENHKNLNVLLNLIDYTAKKEFGNNDNYKYNQLDARNYDYIVGNKDWFVAIDRNYNVKATCLPYDKRAKIEYEEAFKKALNEIFNRKKESEITKTKYLQIQ